MLLADLLGQSAVIRRTLTHQQPFLGEYGVLLRVFHVELI